jgi:hypothetical protein
MSISKSGKSFLRAKESRKEKEEEISFAAVQALFVNCRGLKCIQA